MNNFKNDVKFGNDGEKIICLYLILQGMEYISYNNNYKYDLEMYSNKEKRNVLFEVKTDAYEDTGNIAIETQYKGKDSGITHTEAEWFVYFYSTLPFNNVWMIRVKELKKLIEDNDFKVVMGGDDNQSELVLIPRKEYKKHFRIDTIKLTKNK